jgi:branched-chain amino acid aminotransferase
MSRPIAYLDGRFVPFAEARLPLHDAGFVSGATVVDNVRTFKHRLFRWSDHLARFRRDCNACCVPLDVTDEQLTATAEELVAHNAKLLPATAELQLVTFATPGPLGFYLGDAANGPPTLGMATYPLPFARYRPFFNKGITLVGVGGQVSHPKSVLRSEVKHRSRMVWHIADHKARGLTGNPAALGILLGPGEILIETSIANFLAVIDGAVVSPERSKVLDGISLRVTRELCATLGIAFVEAPLVPDDLERASEAMLTGTAFCLAAVREVIAESKEPLRFDWPGPVFRRLLAAWCDHVGIDIESQFTRA